MKQISISALREHAHGWVTPVTVQTILALVEAVEAAQADSEVRVMTIPELRERFGDDWTVEVGTRSGRVLAALARFDFGEET
jgi:hypothetical protein